jgi:hypothetical protein
LHYPRRDFCLSVLTKSPIQHSEPKFGCAGSPVVLHGLYPYQVFLSRNEQTDRVPVGEGFEALRLDARAGVRAVVELLYLDLLICFEHKILVVRILFVEAPTYVDRTSAPVLFRPRLSFRKLCSKAVCLAVRQQECKDAADDCADDDDYDFDDHLLPFGPRGSTVSGRHIAYWITSSARCSSDCGIVRPRALAVLRLITSSNFVGCSMGRSPGFAPFRILST